MTDTLVAIVEGREMGRVRRARGRLTFTYAEGWRASRSAFPLSLSIPLTAAEHGHSPVEAFLWGLLPDNELILDRWAKRFHVSARNPFGLMSHVGEDCAGAVQFVSPDRLAAVQEGSDDEVEWLDEAGVARRLRALRADQAAWRLPRDTGQFSLAGAQAKTALFFDGERWAIPRGRAPTTHILKPPAAEFDGHAENEHLCLELARGLGLPVARSAVRRFEGEVAIVVERYDRFRTDDGVIHRVHQEDLCQALGVLPVNKYQNEGGPGPREIVDLLRVASASPAEDVQTFLDGLILNWIIGGTDAHAKNYALLLGAGRTVRLAPLYDVASALAYADWDSQKLKLAMKIGGEYRLRDIGLRQWDKLARELGFKSEAVLTRVDLIAGRLPGVLAEALRRTTVQGLAHPVLPRLEDVLSHRAAEVAASFRA